MSLYGLLFAKLLSCPLACQSLLHASLLARFQVVGVTFHFFNDVFLLNFALEPTQSVFQRLALLQSNFCQVSSPLTGPNRTHYSLPHFRPELESAPGAGRVCAL